MKAEAPVQPASSSNKATVDTHRGGADPLSLEVPPSSIVLETYQFCYFFRKNEPHSVVLKVSGSMALDHIADESMS